MPVKKKQTLTDKSVKQSINIKIGDVRPKTKRVQRKRKPKTQIEVQPEVQTIYQTGLSRDIGAYTDEVNKRNEALKEEFKLKAKKEEEEAKKKAEEEAKKKVVLTAEVIPTATPIVQGIVYDYKKNSVFNPESLEPKSTTISKEVIENKPLFSTERKPKEPVYDNKKYATPAGAFFPQSTTMGEKSQIPTPENIIKERGRPLTDETTKFIRQTNKKIQDKREIYVSIKNTILNGELKGKPLENAKKKLNKLNDEIIELQKMLDEVE